MFLKYRKQREDVAYFMRRLYERGLTTTSGGNISLRTDSGKILITPSQSDKARMAAKQIAILDENAKNFTPSLKPSIETQMHLSILKKRPDLKAVVHAHPVFATSFACSNKAVNIKLIAESFVVIKNPFLASYAIMGSKDLANTVAEAFMKSDCILMQNHGIITGGKTLLEAFDKLEVLEAAAKMTIITDLIKDYSQLSEEQCSELKKFF